MLSHVNNKKLLTVFFSQLVLTNPELPFKNACFCRHGFARSPTEASYSFSEKLNVLPLSATDCWSSYVLNTRTEKQEGCLWTSSHKDCWWRHSGKLGALGRDQPLKTGRVCSTGPFTRANRWTASLGSWRCYSCYLPQSQWVGSRLAQCGWSWCHLNCEGSLQPGFPCSRLQVSGAPVSPDQASQQLFLTQRHWWCLLHHWCGGSHSHWCRVAMGLLSLRWPRREGRSTCREAETGP